MSNMRAMRKCKNIINKRGRNLVIEFYQETDFKFGRVKGPLKNILFSFDVS